MRNFAQNLHNCLDRNLLREGQELRWPSPRAWREGGGGSGLEARLQKGCDAACSETTVVLQAASLMDGGLRPTSLYIRCPSPAAPDNQSSVLSWRRHATPVRPARATSRHVGRHGGAASRRCRGGSGGEGSGDGAAPAGIPRQ